MRRIISILMAISLLGLSLLPSLINHAQADVVNLMANSSVETLDASGNPTNWTPNTWGTSTTNLTVTNDAHTGTNALSVVSTARTDGDAKWMPDAVAVTSGSTYTYTDYSKATVPTELDAVYTDASGNVTYNYLTAVQSSSAWQQNTVNLTVPTGEVKVAVWHILSTTGSLTTDDFSLTQQSQVQTPPPTGSNLIANPSMETANGNAPAGWQTGNWGTNTANFSYVTGDAHTGNASAKVQITSYTDGDAKWYFSPVAVQPGMQYTFSDFYKATVPTSLIAQFDDGAGNYTYSDLVAPAAASNWTQTTATFTAPANAKHVTVLHVLAAVGTLQTDDASLTPAQAASGNLFQNPSLETVSSTASLPQDWEHGDWGTNTASFAYVNNSGHTGTHSVKVTLSSWTNGAAYWEPTAPSPVTGGQNYDFSDYFKSNIPSEIDATFNMADGSTQYMYLGGGFDSPSSWTKFDTQFTAPVGAVSVVIVHDIYSVGYLTTDDYSLKTFNYQGFKRPLVTITDDDGYANFYTNGLPILKKYGLPSTAYIISGYINQPEYVTAAQVKALKAAGVEIGSHSVDHPDLTALTSAQQTAELQNSQTALQQLLGVPVKDYAAPYGAFNAQVTGKAKTYYQTYRTVMPGYNAKDNFNPMNLYVQNITASTTTADIQGWVKQAQATNTWLILVYHEVSNTPSGGSIYNTPPSDFDSQMAAIKNSGITVETMAQAMQEINPQL